MVDEFDQFHRDLGFRSTPAAEQNVYNREIYSEEWSERALLVRDREQLNRERNY